MWGTGAADAGIVWDSAADGDNIVWGTDGDNVVWGTDGDNVVWGTGRLREPLTQTDWYRLFLHRRFSLWWVANEFGDRFGFRKRPCCVQADEKPEAASALVRSSVSGRPSRRLPSFPTWSVQSSLCTAIFPEQGVSQQQNILGCWRSNVIYKTITNVVI